MQPSCRALVPTLVGIIVFKTDRQSHIPGQDRRLRSPAEETPRPVLNEQQELSPFPSEGTVPPLRPLKYKEIWENSTYTLGSRGPGDQRRAG